jgi:glycosyltransferase involved in cell wall biosynthesis
MGEGDILLSVALITKNEEDRLPKTLEAVKDLADEIVVVDSGSTDRTVEVARSFGAKVFTEEWKGYARQRQSALKKCRGKWILFLDADEVLSEELKWEIKRVLKNPTAEGYLIKRKTVYLGKVLNHIWDNDWVLRLVKRDANPRWVGRVHEKLLLEGRVEKIPKGVIYHYTYRNLWEHFEKALLYARLSAEEYHRRGKRATLFKLVGAPLWAFFKIYLLKRGFLEGIRGLLIAGSYALNAFVKYALLWEKQKGN